MFVNTCPKLLTKQLQRNDERDGLFVCVKTTACLEHSVYKLVDYCLSRVAAVRID